MQALTLFEHDSVLPQADSGSFPKKLRATPRLAGSSWFDDGSTKAWDLELA